MVVQLYLTPLVEHEVFDFKRSIHLHEGPGELEITKKKKKKKPWQAADLWHSWPRE